MLFGRDDEWVGCCHHPFQSRSIGCRQRSIHRKICPRNRCLRQVRDQCELSQPLQYTLRPSLAVLWASMCTAVARLVLSTFVMFSFNLPKVILVAWGRSTCLSWWSDSGVRRSHWTPERGIGSKRLRNDGNGVCGHRWKVRVGEPAG